MKARTSAILRILCLLSIPHDKLFLSMVNTIASTAKSLQTAYTMPSSYTNTASRHFFFIAVVVAVSFYLDSSTLLRSFQLLSGIMLLFWLLAALNQRDTIISSLSSTHSSISQYLRPAVIANTPATTLRSCRKYLTLPPP